MNGVATGIISFICYPLIAKKDSYSWIGRMRMTMMAIGFIFITCTFPVKQRYFWSLGEYDLSGLLT